MFSSASVPGKVSSAPCLRAAVVLALAVAFLWGARPGHAASISVDQETFEVPAPAGFEEVVSISDDVRRFAESITPRGNRLLAAFLPAAQVQQLRNGEAPEWHRYMLVQVQQRMEAMTFTAPEFDELKRHLAEQQAALAARTEIQPEDLLRDDGAGDAEGDAEQGVRVDAIVPAGTFADTERLMSIVTLTRYRVSNASDRYTTVVAAGTNLLRLGDKLLFFYVYSTYGGKDDLNWVQQTSTTWVDAVLAANPGTATSDVGPSGDSRDLMIAAAIVIVVIVVVFVALAARRAKPPSDSG